MILLIEYQLPNPQTSFSGPLVFDDIGITDPEGLKVTWQDSNGKIHSEGVTTDTTALPKFSTTLTVQSSVGGSITYTCTITHSLYASWSYIQLWTVTTVSKYLINLFCLLHSNQLYIYPDYLYSYMERQ